MTITKKLVSLAVAGAVLAGGALSLSGSSSASADGNTTPATTTSPNQTASAAQVIRQVEDHDDHDDEAAILHGRNESGSTSVTVRPHPALSDSPKKGVVNTRLIHRPGQAVMGTDTGAWPSMYDFMYFLVEDTAAVWNWYYQQWGFGSSSVNYYFSSPGEVVQSACNGGVLTDDGSPFYCPADDTIYFSQVRAAWYWNQAGGDFGVAAAMAHEYGHNVQTELNISREVYGSARFEMYADCLAGAFANVAYYQDILDANDVNEGMQSRWMVGDEDFSNPDHHGTPAQRRDAFLLGYNSQGPKGCDDVLFS